MITRRIGNIKCYDKRKRVLNFIAIIKNGEVQKIKEFTNPSEEYGYILPRNISDLEEAGIDECSQCGHFFPDGLYECDHCSEKFCCECSEDHREGILDEQSTGGCKY